MQKVLSGNAVLERTEEVETAQAREEGVCKRLGRREAEHHRTPGIGAPPLGSPKSRYGEFKPSRKVDELSPRLKGGQAGRH